MVRWAVIASLWHTRGCNDGDGACAEEVCHNGGGPRNAPGRSTKYATIKRLTAINCSQPGALGCGRVSLGNSPFHRRKSFTHAALRVIDFSLCVGRAQNVVIRT